MGLLRHFFACNDVDRKVKYWVYAASPLNTLLWGCKSWNMTEQNLKHLSSFHHKVIKRILSLKWEKVKEEKVMNKEVRWWFNNIPNIETYIIRRTSRYIRKVIRSEKNNIPWKLLSAWIFTPRLIGRPQNSCNNNFLITISALIPEVKKNWQISELDSPCWWGAFLEQQNQYTSCGITTPNSDDETKNAEPSIW